MKKLNIKKNYKKIALALSLCAIVAWLMLGTGASLAWFTDTSEEVENIFHFADFDLEVSYQLTDGKWQVIDSQQRIFDDYALYEPGYVQVVYLKVENKGDREFMFKAAVNVTGYTLATNALGQTFNLQDHLLFGVVADTTLDGVKDRVANREMAAAVANMRLNNYTSEQTLVDAGGTYYMALIVRMPESVNNVANYRGSTVPTVELGVILNAEQVIEE